MIHGMAEDFVPDDSEKLVLAHIARQPTRREKEIGTFVDFGVQDVLIPARQDYRLRAISDALLAYFPQAPVWERDLLLNGVVNELSRGLFFRRRAKSSKRFFWSSEAWSKPSTEKPARRPRFSAGTLIGELHVLTGLLATQTWRARSFVTILEIPKVLYTLFIRKNTDLDEQLRVAKVTLAIQNTSLFGDSVSSIHQTRIARKARVLEVAEGEEPLAASGESGPSLFLVESGFLALEFEGRIVETVGPGGFCGEERLFFRGPDNNMTARAVMPTRGLLVPADTLLSIPIVGWKLLETYERRLTAFLGQVAQT